MQAFVVTSETDPRSPGLRDMGPPLVLAPLVAAAVFGVATLSWPAAKVAAVTAAGAVLLVGWPVIFWMLDNGRRGPTARTVAGIVCGAAPLAAALLSGIIGLYIKSNSVTYVRWALGHGASVPYFGVVTWPRFWWFLVLAMLSGVVTMVVANMIRAEGKGQRAKGG
jgi:hypothetical protein